jgi:MFS transporter, FSR family, fosmidomycin resistance protein
VRGIRGLHRRGLIVKAVGAGTDRTFIPLYWIRHLGAGRTLGGLAPALVLGGGVLDTLLGGRIADRIGMVRTVQIGNAAMLPALVILLACGDEYAALPAVLLVGVISNIPFAVLVRLGQDHLPSRPGTARPASPSGSR